MSSSSAILALCQWQIRFHEAMAALLRAQEAVNQQIGLWAPLNGLWKCSRHLKALNTTLKAISELPDGTLSEDFIQSQIPQLGKLLSSVEDLLATAKHKGWMNHSLTAAPLGLISVGGEYIADYLDALEMSIDPQFLAAIKEGHDQIEREEFELMERLF